MDSIQEKALKMALSFIVHFVCTSQKFSVFTSNRPTRLMMFRNVVTSPRLPLVEARGSFLSGVRLGGELHGPGVKVAVTPI
jgi:hypothetical protein